MFTINETLQAGLDHHHAGRLHEAEKEYRRVLELHPRHAQAVHLLGLIAYQIDEPDKAIEYIGSAILLDRFNPVFHADLGEILRVRGMTAEATAACAKALELDPKLAEVRNCLGLLQQTEDNHADAIASFRAALELKPEYAGAQANLGTSLRAVGQLAEAQAAFERAVQLAPNSTDNYLSLGVALYDQGKLLDAIACYQKTLRLSPANIRAQYNCSLARLALGDFANGWREFEARHAFEELVRRRYDLPMWHGAAPQTGSVLIHAEQGFGDTLQFVRYVPLVEQRGFDVVLDVQQELVSLVEQSGYKNVRCDGVVPPNCSYQVPMLSLPRLLGTTLESIPAKIPYLSARDDLIAKWRDKLAPHRGLRVGIAWQGRPTYYNDRARSIPLRQFAPLAAVEGVQLVSLQKGAGAEQLAELAANWPIVDVADELVDFHETAALVCNLDLIIGCDSAVGHLAGGLGRPAWLALTVGSDWRWLQNRTDSPWYPRMQLFRQKELGGWEDVFAEMAGQLTALASAKDAPPE